jgi:hypothetical protein
MSGQPEWALYRDTALKAGIPADALLLEKKSDQRPRTFIS